MVDYSDMMFEICGNTIVGATHKVTGRIDNEFRLTLSSGKVIVFTAEMSEFGFDLVDDANCVVDESGGKNG